MKILAGDIGGTKTLLQLVEVTTNNRYIHYETRFDSQSWSGLIPLVAEFLSKVNSQFLPQAACFAVAGTVVDNKYARLTNLEWDDLDALQLASHFGISRVTLINDFQAIGYGIAGLQEQDIVILQNGEEISHAPRVVIGAGTGLGESILIWQDGYYLPLTSEGGHVDFAPRDAEQIALLNFLLTRYDHISYERLLSGAGLIAIYQFLVTHQPLFNHIICEDAAAISAAALNSDPTAISALKLFVKIYGQQTGNFALTCLARGGVYIAGGIAPRILPFLQDGEFIRAFCDKGRMQPLMLDMPVRVIINHQVGLIGATLVASA